ncbi:MAG: type II secretion system GspH family protein [Actinobacteria bacterium]|nr:type II secretion system GspH family protein [Actinomycetota bacterium]
MSALRRLIERAKPDQGMSLIEVVVAMLVFAVIAAGVGYSTIAIVKITNDARARQVATNLATSEIDVLRGLQDPFLITNNTKTVTVGQRTYTVIRSVSWVEANGTDVGCGTGSGVMQSKRVNVTVKWDNQLNTTPDVRTDTLISPDQRINDPSLGTVRVSVLNVAGTGSQGVSVTIAPTSGGAALSEQPAATDSDGCSFALKVAPGTYSVTINRSNSIDTSQLASPSKSVTVVAGGSVAALFQYDYAATFNLSYSTAGYLLPSNLDTTFLSTYGAYVVSGGAKSQALLHPVPSGYAGIAGKYIAPVAGNAGCVNVDPATWPEATVNGKVLAAGVRTPNVAAAPQGSTGMSIPVGSANVTMPSSAYLFAVSVAGPSGAADPGCAAAPTYNFGVVSGTKTIALPYGSWVLYYGANANGSGKIPVPSGNVGLVGTVIGGVVAIVGGSGGATITLDPRQPK